MNGSQKMRLMLPFLVVLLSASCAGGSRSQGTASDGSAVPTMGVDVDRPFSSLEELGAGSDAIVRATARGAAPTIIADIPFVDTVVQVEEAFAGAAFGREMLVRQLDQSGMIAEELPPTLEQGRTYILFLSLCDPGDSGKTGEVFCIAGTSGVFEIRGDQAVNLDPASSLVASDNIVPVAEIEARISATSLG